MQQRKIAIIAGNGLTIGFTKLYQTALSLWNPSCPLTWELATPGNSNIPLLDSLPHLKEAIHKIKNQSSDLSDFEIFQQIFTLDNFKVTTECRHFIAIAYSYFHNITNNLEISNWYWYQWIKKYKNNLAIAVSFNYELLLERILRECSLSYSYSTLGLINPYAQVPLIKPHGSINFDTKSISFLPQYPIRIFCDKNNTPIRLLNNEELLNPRIQPLAVLPHEQSPYTSFQWVQPGYTQFNELGKSLTHCIIIGMSYMNCDRAEINYLISCLNQATTLIIANPNDPPSELLKQAKQKNIKDIKIWKRYPEELQ